MVQEVLGTFQSQKQARRNLDELATQGKWSPVGSTEHSVVYGYSANESDVRVQIVKRALRQWQVVKESKKVRKQ